LETVIPFLFLVVAHPLYTLLIAPFIFIMFLSLHNLLEIYYLFDGLLRAAALLRRPGRSRSRLTPAKVLVRTEVGTPGRGTNGSPASSSGAASLF
jgi:hypothetical protein